MVQKHTAIKNGKRLLWYSERLWHLAADLEPFAVTVKDIVELDQNCWFTSREPTLREMSRHFQKMQDTDPRHPIILNADGSLMDGGHRICKAIVEGRDTIMAVQFKTMPEADEVLELAP